MTSTTTSASTPTSRTATGSAPEVTVRLFAAAHAALGTGEVTVTAATVAEALEAALAQAPDGAADEARAVFARSSVLVNQVSADRDRALGVGDRVDVLPPFAGG